MDPKGIMVKLKFLSNSQNFEVQDMTLIGVSSEQNTKSAYKRQQLAKDKIPDMPIYMRFFEWQIKRLEQEASTLRNESLTLSTAVLDKPYRNFISETFKATGGIGKYLGILTVIADYESRKIE